MTAFETSPAESGQPHIALYYDGKSAKARPVRLILDSREILRICDIEDESIFIAWPGHEIVPTGSLHDFPLQLRRKKDTGERLSIEDPASRHFIEAWLGPRLKAQGFRKLRNWLIAGGATWALIALVWMNMDTVLNVVVSVVPESWEHRLGRESKEQIARLLTLTPVGEIPWCRDAQGTAALEKLAARLDMPMTPAPEAGAGGEPGAEAGPKVGAGAALPNEDTQPVEIAVLDSKMINAFALPGRHIVVTSAMIKEADTPEELAGVLAHEMAHVTERHSTKRVLRAYGIGLIFQLMAGQGDLFNAVGGFGNTLVQNKFSRTDEALADRLGAERLAASGMNPTALADLFEKIQAKEREDAKLPQSSGMWEYLSDHPDFASRIAEIYEFARAAEQEAGAPPPQPALSEADWADLKNICGED